MPTRLLLQLAAFAALECILGIATSAPNTAIALINPLVYAVTGTIWMLLPMTARLWSAAFGSATAVGAIAGLLLMPFHALGLLLPLSLAAQGLLFDLALWNSRKPTLPHVIGAAAIAGAAMGVFSLPVIDSSWFSAWFIIGIVTLRTGSMVALALLSLWVTDQLKRRGIRPMPDRPRTRPRRA